MKMFSEQISILKTSFTRARTTMKAGMQERGTEVMWFHTGNYDAGSHDQR